MAHARRAGAPWNEASSLVLSAGPHLFLDWRFVLPGELGLIGPYWAGEDGQEIKLRVGHLDKWKDRPHRCQVRLPGCAARHTDRRSGGGEGPPFAEDGPPGSHVIYDEGVYRTWYGSPMNYAESSDGYEWGEGTACEVDRSACPEAGDRGEVAFIDPSAPRRRAVQDVLPWESRGYGRRQK